MHHFFKKLLIGAFSTAISFNLFLPTIQAQSIKGDTEKILSRIQIAPFKDKHYDIRNFGAAADGKSDSCTAINQAIAAASSAGGGIVEIPAGTYFVAGPIVLKNDVKLYLDDSAILKFSGNPKDYAKSLVLTRYECTELYNFSPLIYADHAKHIAIASSGDAQQGILDGSGSSWWSWKGGKKWNPQNGPTQKEDRTVLQNMANDSVPVENRKFGPGHYLRPIFIEPYQSEEILIQGITLKNSPMFNISPALSKNIQIDHVTIDSDGPNTDGIDPDSCKDVLISSNVFNTGDDCIAIKSGRDEDGRRLHTPSENIVIKDNIFKNGHSAVTIGSEISGGANHIYSINNVMDSPNLQYAYRIKTNSERGGTIKDFYADGDTINHISKNVFLVDMDYEGGDIGKYTPYISSIHLNHLQANANDNQLLNIKTYERNPVENFSIENSTFTNVRVKNKKMNEFTGTKGKNIKIENVNVNGKMYNETADF